MLGLPIARIGRLPLSALATQTAAPDVESVLMKELHRDKMYVPMALYLLQEDEWVLETDEKVIAQKSYLYVSYSRLQFAGSSEDRSQIEDSAQYACEANGLDACWIDYVCMGKDDIDNSEALYRMGDVIRNAAMTLILIGPGNDNPRSSLWLQWGSRLWTLVELIFSRKILLRVGFGNIVNTDCRRLCKMVYNWEDNDVECKLIYALSRNACLGVKQSEIVEALVCVLWSERASETLTSSCLERVSALSAFLPHQIEHTQDSEKAFKDLMEGNNLAEHNFSYPSKSMSVLLQERLLVKISIPIVFFHDPEECLYPTALMGRSPYSGNWVIQTKVIGRDYVVLSYRQNRISYEALRFTVEQLCWHALELNAYWIDAYCMMSGYGAAQELYHFGDAFLRAKITLIMLPHPTAEHDWSEMGLWREWGNSVWSIVEILLSGSDIKYVVGNGHMNTITRRQVFMNAYGRDSREMVLVDLVERTLDNNLSEWEILAYLIDAIWRRNVKISGKLCLSIFGEEEPPIMPTYEAERVYALMAFMPVRIFPEESESEYDALGRLLRVNNYDDTLFREWLQEWCKSNIPTERHLSSLLSLQI